MKSILFDGAIREAAPLKPNTRAAQWPPTPQGFKDFVNHNSFSNARGPAACRKLMNRFQNTHGLSELGRSRVWQVWQGHWKLGGGEVKYLDKDEKASLMHVDGNELAQIDDIESALYDDESSALKLHEAWGGNDAEAFTRIFKQCVPPSGTGNSKYGEVCRAINKIVYRCFNDGDVFHTGYGIETAGPAACFLGDMAPPSIQRLIGRMEGASGEAYENMCDELVSAFVNLSPEEVTSLSDQPAEDMYEWADTAIEMYGSPYPEDDEEEEEEDYYEEEDDDEE